MKINIVKCLKILGIALAVFVFSFIGIIVLALLFAYDISKVIAAADIIIRFAILLSATLAIVNSVIFCLFYRLGINIFWLIFKSELDKLFIFFISNIISLMSFPL